jgi:head-tail adaptor
VRFKGAHTERIILKKKAVTLNRANEEIILWDTQDVPVYAEFWERNGKEAAADGVQVATQDIRCKIRYRRELDPTQQMNNPLNEYRLVRGNKMYKIENVIVQGRKKEMFLNLTSRDNEVYIPDVGITHQGEPLTENGKVIINGN